MRVILVLVPALVPVSSVMPKVNDARAWKQRCCLCHYQPPNRQSTWSLRTFQFDLFTEKPGCKLLCQRVGVSTDGSLKVNKHTCDLPVGEQTHDSAKTCATDMNTAGSIVDKDTSEGPQGVKGFERAFKLGHSVTSRGQAGKHREEALSFFIQALLFKAADPAWVKAATGDDLKFPDNAFEGFIEAYAEALRAPLGKPGADKPSKEEKQRACARYNECLRRAASTCSGEHCFYGDRKEACYFKYDFVAKKLTMPFKPEAKPVRFRG